MNARILIALVFCSFTVAAGCGALDEEPPATNEAVPTADTTELQTFAQKGEKAKPKCEGRKPKNLGQSCGCGNTFQCDGTCSGGSPIPAEFGQSCGCGNTVQCNGTCSGGDAIPADFDQPCGCGGRVQCNGTCSIPCPL